MILFIVAIQNIPEDLYEAADIDGANAIKKFFFITLPEIRGHDTDQYDYYGDRLYQEYDEVFVTTNGGPGKCDGDFGYISVQSRV